MILDAEALCVTEAWIDDRVCAWELAEGRLRLASAEPTGPTAVARVRFEGVIAQEPQGLYGGPGYVATQMQPAYARRVFPCFDDPAFKTPYDLSVVCASGAALSNGGGRTSRSADGRSRTTFATTPPIPTHLLALAVGQFTHQTVETATGPIAFHTLGDGCRGELVLQVAEASLAFYGDWLGRTYSFNKLDLVALPQTGMAGMENTAAVFLRQDVVALESATASPTARRHAASLVAHELAHQWFGSAVSPASWSELWLNEGFATWLAAKALAQIAPDLATEADAVLAIRRALAADDVASGRPLCARAETIAEVGALFDSIAYQKGAGLLRMLEAWLGDTAMRQGLALYLARHDAGVATSRDLWAALSEASGVDVAAVAEPFTQATGAPRFDIGWEGQTVVLAQPAEDLRATPVRLTIGLTDGRVLTLDRVLEDVTLRLDLGAPVQWVFGNAGAAGYYSCTYRDAAWPPADQLSAAEAVVLAEDAWLLLWEGEVDLAQYLSLVDTLLAGGRALESLAPQLDELRDLLAGGARRPLFDRWIAQRLPPGLADALAVEAGAPDAVAGALAGLDAWLQLQPDARSDPGPAVKAVVRHAPSDLYDAVETALAESLAAGETAGDGSAAILLRLLAGFRLTDRLERQVDWLADLRLTSDQLVSFTEALLANPFTQAAAWSRLRDQWSARSGRVSGLGGRGAIGGLSAFADPASLADIAAFFAAHPPPEGRRFIDQAQRRIESRIAFRRHHQTAFDAWMMSRQAAGAISDKVQLDLAVLSAMLAGFRAADEQRGLVDWFGIAAPSWMHSRENLAKALGQTAAWFIPACGGRSPPPVGMLQLATRLHEDLLAAAAQADREIGRLVLKEDQAAVRGAVAALARVQVGTAGVLEGDLLAGGLSGAGGADGERRRQLAEARNLAAHLRSWPERARATASNRAERQALQNDAALVPAQLRWLARDLAQRLAAAAPGAAPHQTADSWSDAGLGQAAARAWQAAGFDEPVAAAAWASRGFSPKDAVRLAAAGADPRALRMRPQPGASPARRLTVKANRTTFQVEVAADHQTRAQGLMHRDSVPARTGMLFIFPDERPRPFFMKNVRQPLDILWLDPGLVITHIEAQAPAWSAAPRPVTARQSRCRYVLELAGGAAAAAGLNVGDRLEVDGLGEIAVS